MNGATGRPPIPFNEAIADFICEETSSSDKSLHRILNENPAFPRITTILKWLANEPIFADNYARAKDVQADFVFGQVLEIADRPLIGEKRKIMGDGTEEVTVGDNVDRSRLAVDARKWVAAHLAPKRYGKRTEHEHSHSMSVSVSLASSQAPKEIEGGPRLVSDGHGDVE